MELTSLLLGLLIGLIGGVLVAHFWKRTQGHEAMDILQREQATERSEWDRQLNEQRALAEERMGEVVRLSGLVATEQERGRGLNQRLVEQKGELEQLQTRMTTEFENIAGRLLSQRGKELQDQQQEKLGVILKPLQERIMEFQQQVRDAYDKEGRERFALKGEIIRLVEQNQKLSQKRRKSNPQPPA